jgi:hypothetical protein
MIQKSFRNNEDSYPNIIKQTALSNDSKQGRRAKGQQG